MPASSAPKVSILMPVKNAEQFLQECIQSILEQSYSDFELLAVNDNSSDDSLAILQYFALQDERIQVLSNTGKGIIDALDLAFRESKGTYLTRMDADDKMASHKLENMVELLDKWGRGHIVLGLVKYFSATELGDGYKRYEKWLNSLTDKENNFSDVYRECVIPSPCWMLHRTDLVNCHAFEPNRYPEDYDLCFRFYQSGLKPKSVKSVLHYWRDYPERSSRTDPNYLDNRFFDIKLHYFLKLEWDDNTKLVILGAGKKAKYLAKRLREQNLKFDWYTNNLKKIGQEVYGIVLKNQSPYFEQIVPNENAHLKEKIIIAISNPEEQDAVEKQLHAKELALGSDYFFFC